MAFQRAHDIPKWPKICKYLNSAKHVRKLLSVKKAAPTNAGAVPIVILLALLKKYLQQHINLKTYTWIIYMTINFVNQIK